MVTQQSMEKKKGGLNNFIMKVTKERNPYLKRIFSQTPHKYSFDLESGKHFLLDAEGTPTQINPNGTHRPRFRQHYSGFVDHKARYRDAANDPSVLHFAPDPSPHTPYHNPLPDKFAGYAQCPYKLKPEFPSYLKPPDSPGKYYRPKAQSLILTKAHSKGISLGNGVFKQKKKAHSDILEFSILKEGQEEQKYFNSAWGAMSETKPLPKQRKKTCYNYKCKYMKQWVFDHRGQLTQSKGEALGTTQGRSFHEEALTQEMQESKLLSTMALSGVA